MKTIPLSQLQVAYVDDDKYEYINQWKWYARWDPGTKSFYAQRSVPIGNGKTKVVMMHRIIMNTPVNLWCDHRDHNTINNLRKNLRNITYRQNHENRKNQSKHGVGVTRRKSGHYEKPFVAYAVVGEKQRHIGCFSTSEEASAAREKFLLNNDQDYKPLTPESPESESL